MKPYTFARKVSALADPQAKRIVLSAKIAIVLLFVFTMVSTGIMAWLLFTGPHKIICAIALCVLGVVSFFGGRLHREVHEANAILQAKHSVLDCSTE